MSHTRPSLFLHLFSACALMAYTVLACTVTPAYQTVPKEELMERTKTIALAKAVKEEALPGGRMKYTFKTERSVKGAADAEFTIEGSAREPGNEPGTFNDHQDPSFWETARGRSVHDTDCRIHPSFTVGEIYLIFLDGTYHQKSFEKIERTDGEKKDKWLAWVEEQAKKK